MVAYGLLTCRAFTGHFFFVSHCLHMGGVDVGTDVGELELCNLCLHEKTNEVKLMQELCSSFGATECGIDQD